MCLYIYRLNTKIRLRILCLSGFELYSRWVPLMWTTGWYAHPGEEALSTGDQEKSLVKSPTKSPVRIVLMDLHPWKFSLRTVDHSCFEETKITIFLWAAPMWMTDGLFMIRAQKTGKINWETSRIPTEIFSFVERNFPEELGYKLLFVLSIIFVL